MYNRKSRVSAILTIVAAVLLIGLMVMLPFLQYYSGDSEGLGEAIGIVVTLVIVLVVGYGLTYVSSIPFVIVGVVFSILMFRQQSRKKLISYNVRMLITTCVLLPFLVIGLTVASEMIFSSTLGVFPIIYTAVVGLAYLASLVMQIVTIILLKKSPDEDDLYVPEEDSTVAE